MFCAPPYKIDLQYSPISGESKSPRAPVFFCSGASGIVLDYVHCAILHLMSSRIFLNFITERCRVNLARTPTKVWLSYLMLVSTFNRYFLPYWLFIVASPDCCILMYFFILQIYFYVLFICIFILLKVLTWVAKSL